MNLPCPWLTKGSIGKQCGCYDTLSEPSVLVTCNLTTCVDVGDPASPLGFLLHDGDSLFTKLSSVFLVDEVFAGRPVIFFFRGGIFGAESTPTVYQHYTYVQIQNKIKTEQLQIKLYYIQNHAYLQIQVV